MTQESTGAQSDGYRFGVFEVRLRESRLLRHGRPIRIQKLPFAVLISLLESSGQILAREDLKARLWGDQTHVDFDNGLHVAVAKLRETLGENASRPRYIRTVPGLGYQFIGAIEPTFVAPPPEVEAAPKVPEPVAPPVLPEPPPAAGWQRRWLASAALLMCFFAVAGVLFLRRSHRTGPVSREDRVLLGRFVNATGDPQLDGMFTPGFRVKFQESPYFDILAPPSLNLAPAEAQDSAAELAACRQQNAAVYIGGTLRRRGSGYEVAVTAHRCTDGSQMLERTGSADSVDALIPILGETVASLRRAMGEPSDHQDRFDTSLTKATTSSPAAMKAFSLGDQHRAQGKNAEAIADYKVAVALDPRFSLAYGRLGSVYSNVYDNASSVQFFAKAYELRERATDRERLYIAGHYFSDVTGEIDQGIETYRLWLQLYPRDEIPYNNLAVAYLIRGRPDLAEGMARGAIRLNPLDTQAQGNLAQADLELGKYDELHSICGNTLLWTRATNVLHRACFWLGFNQGNEAAMAHEVQWAEGKSDEPVLLVDQAWVLASRGDLAAARRMLATARQIAAKGGQNAILASIDLDAAMMEATVGSAALVKADAARALRYDSSGMAHGVAGLALAAAGDAPQAASELRQATLQLPQNTILNAVIAPSIGAAIALYGRDPNSHGATQAIEDLHASQPYEWTSGAGFASIYYRGLAYEAAGQPRKAAAEFDRILNHRSVDAGSPFVALAAVEQVRALEASGDHTTATRQAEELTQRWHDASPDFAPLTRLRREASRRSKE